MLWANRLTDADIDSIIAECDAIIGGKSFGDDIVPSVEFDIDNHPRYWCVSGEFDTVSFREPSEVLDFVRSL